MGAVKVEITMGGSLVWTEHFDNCPSINALKHIVPRAHSGNPDPRELLDRVVPGLWVTIDRPMRLAQLVSSCGVDIGKIEMFDIVLLATEPYDYMKKNPEEE
jgi:hypothetical protein